MSSSLTISRIESLQREIQSLQRQLTNESRNQAAKAARVAEIKRSITKYTSPSMLQSKQREIERNENDVVKIQQKQADLNKRIADKTAELHKSEQKFRTEQDSEQKKTLESLKRKAQEDKRGQEAILTQVRSISQPMPIVIGAHAIPESIPSYDAFISHAGEDKDDFVRPLAEALKKRGLSIWYDEFQLRVGDSLRRSIDHGLKYSRFGIVILSPNFFAKNWPQYELDGLVEKEMKGGKVILPIWHKVSKDEVFSYSPSLADKFALNTAMNTIEELAEKLEESLREN